MLDVVSLILSFILGLVFLWFTYSIVNILVTFFRCRKQDHSLELCLNTGGYIFYTILTLVYLIATVGGIILIIYGLITSNMSFFHNGINIIAFISVVYAYFASTIVLVGRKNLMVGRMLIDYRKLKKVNYTYNNKVTFVYAQKDYSFPTRFTTNDSKKSGNDIYQRS